MKCYKWPYGTMDKVSAYGAGDSGTSPAGPFLLMQSAATSPRGSDCRASRVRERKRRPINRSNANHNPTCTRKTFTETGSFGLGIAAIGGGHGATAARLTPYQKLKDRIYLPSSWPCVCACACTCRLTCARNSQAGVVHLQTRTFADAKLSSQG